MNEQPKSVRVNMDSGEKTWLTPLAMIAALGNSPAMVRAHYSAAKKPVEGYFKD